jgi:TonB family protein
VYRRIGILEGPKIAGRPVAGGRCRGKLSNRSGEGLGGRLVLCPDEPQKNGIMKLLPLPLVCSALWLAVPISAQAGAKATDQTSLQIIQTHEFGFPRQLDNGPVMNGDATVAINVDWEGRLTDCLVTGYSRKEFADAAVAALKASRFDPPRVNGVPLSTVKEVHFIYSRTGVVVSITAFDYLAYTVDEMAQGRYAYRLRTPSELDRLPKAVRVVSPANPTLTAGEQQRTVAVDFYIDEEGRVRMPSVSRADIGTECAASALDAVKQWRFEPPLYQGRPTLVSVRQEFNFVVRL